MHKKSKLILIISAILVATGIGLKFGKIELFYIPTLLGMALGFAGLSVFFKEIKEKK